MCAGDAHIAAELVGLTDVQRAGGEADTDVAARWLDAGAAPNGAYGRAFGTRGVHGYDLTFCAPKSVSLVRALRADDVADKAIVSAPIPPRLVRRWNTSPPMPGTLACITR